MNLSYTSIKDAFSLPKVNRQTKGNEYTDINHQKEFLQRKSLPLSNSIPNAYDNQHFHQSIHSEQQVSSISTNKTLSLNISDPKLIKEFEKYNPTYLEEFLKEKIFDLNPIPPPTPTPSPNMIENFMNNMDGDMKQLLMILALIFIIDILIRCRN